MGRKSGYETNFVTLPRLYRLVTAVDYGNSDSGAVFAAIPNITLDGTRVGRQTLILDFLPHSSDTHSSWSGLQPFWIGKFAVFYDMSGAVTTDAGGVTLTTTLNHYNAILLDNAAPINTKTLAYPEYWSVVYTGEVYPDSTHHVIDGVFPGTYKVAWLSDVYTNKIAILWSSLA